MLPTCELDLSKHQMHGQKVEKYAQNRCLREKRMMATGLRSCSPRGATTCVISSTVDVAATSADGNFSRNRTSTGSIFPSEREAFDMGRKVGMRMYPRTCFAHYKILDIRHR